MPGSSSSQALEEASAGPYTRSDFAKRSSGSRVASRLGLASWTEPAIRRGETFSSRPACATHTVSFLGSPRKKRTAAMPASSPRWSMPEAMTCTSAKPRSQRSGSGTFFSTTAPSIVVTTSSSRPTPRCSGSRAPMRASASRSGALTSTLVVPRSNTSPSSAPLSRSSRA